MLRPVILGWEATCSINGTSFGVKAGSIEINIDDEECGDSKNAQVKAHKPGRYDAAVNLEFYEKENISTLRTPPPTLGGVNLFAIATIGTEGAILIGPNSTFRTATEIVLTIDEQGNTAPGKKIWSFPSFVLNNYRDSWNMDGKMEGVLNGRSNGIFATPQG